MRKLNKFVGLSIEDCSNTNGGCFSFDAGWLIGNLVTGSFLSLAGTSDAIADYALHYATTSDCA